MERFSRAHPDVQFHNRNVSSSRSPSTSTQHSPSNSTTTRTTGHRTSSIDSTNTATTHTSTHSRPPSTYTPSYMNAVPARKPVTPRATTPQPPSETTTPTSASRRTPSGSVHNGPTTAGKGSLFLFAAGALHPSTLTYLETMLRRGSYSNIAVIGHSAREVELKNLKIKIYALLGKLSHSSVGVEVKTRDAWAAGEVEGVVQEARQANGTGESVNGVLCSPLYGGEAEEGGHVMDLSETQLQLPWSQSVGFLHAVAKATLPHMLSSGGLFAVTGPTHHSPISAFYKGACENLIEVLSEDPGARGVAIVRAENVLVPEPEAVEAPRLRRQGDDGRQRGKPAVNGIQIPTSNGRNGHAHAYAEENGDGDFGHSESPTKLWNMWALHEQLGAD